MPCAARDDPSAPLAALLTAAQAAALLASTNRPLSVELELSRTLAAVTTLPDSIRVRICSVCCICVPMFAGPSGTEAQHVEDVLGAGISLHASMCLIQSRSRRHGRVTASQGETASACIFDPSSITSGWSYGFIVWQHFAARGLHESPSWQPVLTGGLSWNWSVPQLLLEDVVTKLNAAAGGCERLLSTPVPLSYTRHTSRSMMLWLLSLPLVLWSTMGLATVPATAVITFILIGEGIADCHKAWATAVLIFGPKPLIDVWLPSPAEPQFLETSCA